MSCLPGLGWACNGVSNAIGGAAQSAAGDALNAIATSMLNGATEMLRTLATLWVQVPSAATESPAAWLSGSLIQITGAVAVASLLVSCAKLAITGQSHHATRAVGGLFRLILVNGLGSALVLLMLGWGDQFSKWILDSATNNDPSSHINGISAAITVAFATSSVQMLLGILALIGTIIQIALMFLRIPMLVVVAGLWPLSAAASGTDMGLQWYRKLTGWLIALVLYKPVAATIYAAAFHMMQVNNDPTTVLGGIALTVVAVIALPALMRFFVPMVSAAGGGNGAGAATANLATGAVAVGAAVATLGASSAATGAAGLAGNAAKGPSGAGGSGGPAGGAGPNGGNTPPGTGNGNGNGKGPSGSGDSSSTPLKDAFAAGNTAAGAMRHGKHTVNGAVEAVVPPGNTGAQQS